MTAFRRSWRHPSLLFCLVFTANGMVQQLPHLRAQFKVEASTNTTPMTSRLDVPKNASPTARLLLSTPGAFPQLFAGESLGWWMIRTALSKHALVWIIAVESVILFCTLAGPMLLWMMTRVLGETVEAGIETFDKSLLGVDVEIDTITPDVVKGKLEVAGLIVKNPEEGKYASPYLLKAERVVVDVDMQKLFLSSFKHVDIERLEFKNVDIIWETVIPKQNKSNIQDVLDFLSQHEKKDTSNPLETKPVMKAPKAVEKPAQSATQVSLHQVLIQGVGARAQSKTLGGRGMRIALADLSYRDFEEDVGLGAGAMDDVIVILLKSVLKTVLTNVVGKRFGERCL